jgi:ATP-dependent Lon protease
MEIIRIAGYTEDEKLEIAKRHLLPKQREERTALKEASSRITDEALLQIVRTTPAKPACVTSSAN